MSSYNYHFGRLDLCEGKGEKVIFKLIAKKLEIQYILTSLCICAFSFVYTYVSLEGQVGEINSTAGKGNKNEDSNQGMSQ